MLWQDGKITAVIDWEEASFGDPAYDVAYALLDLYISGYKDVAGIFLKTYETLLGKKVDNLAFWKAAASVRRMPDPGEDLSEGEALGLDQNAAQIRSDFNLFIQSALDNL